MGSYFLTLRLNDFLYFWKWNPTQTKPKTKKTQKNSPRKKTFYFWKWNFPAVILKKKYFLSKTPFLYFLKRKLFLYFRKWNPALFNSSPKNKKVHREKIPYNSGNGTFRTQKVKKSPLLKCFLHIRH